MWQAACRVAAHNGDRQGGPRSQVVRHLVENDPDRQTVIAQHLDAFADLQDHTAVGRQNLGLFAGLRAGGRD